MNQPRAPRGVPTGGEFTTQARPDGDIALGIRNSTAPESATSGEPGSVEYRIAEAKQIAASHQGVDEWGGFDTVKADDTGTIRSYRNGKLHNDAGPAVQHLNGRVEYRVDGKLHNDFDGPTIVTEHGRFGWHRHGKRISAPPAEVQLNGLVDGMRDGFYDMQWARYRGADILGDDVDAFDTFFEQQSAAIDDRNKTAGH